jgi:hypothetical protein
VERESLLCVLIVLMGGLALQFFAGWSLRVRAASAARQLEQQRWFALWRPLVSALVMAAALCGWALSQPDPVPDHVGPLLFVVCAPFAFIIARALARAVWSLLRPVGECGIATIGVIQPHVVVAPKLARSLDERVLEAALAHERAHVEHRDPLRIWIGQIAADLQWPWNNAQQRFADWLDALEHARDDQARAEGIEGADLAAAVLGLLRYQQGVHAIEARLTGTEERLQERIKRLLQPLPAGVPQRELSLFRLVGLIALACAVALALGATFGESLIRPLLALTS